MCLKCDTCAKLSQARRSFADYDNRAYIRQLHAYHRSTYMGERLTYYTRRNRGEQLKHSYLSLITDGMQQTHCAVPYLGNVSNAVDSVPHHVQGIIVHGKKIKMYRTFHNLPNNTNSQIHTLLCTLEEIRAESEAKLPDTVYIQVDGGAENANITMLALCELLVARGLTKHVVLSRLMPGHTHEDIDSKFAIVWMRIRNNFFHTHKQWTDAITDALMNETNPTLMPVECIDILCVPDYEAYFHSHLHSVQRFAKGEWTQLQWFFDFVESNERYPNNVKVTYRKYAADNAVEIVRNPQHPTGLGCRSVSVVTYPLENDEPLYILKTMPSGLPIPQRFIENSRIEIEKTLRSIYRYFDGYIETAAEAWRKWEAEVCPSSDCVEEYVAKHPAMYHIPLKLILFSPSTTELISTNGGGGDATYSISASQMPHYRAQPSVKCGSQRLNGRKRKVSKQINQLLLA